jgi:hypothetical protein
MRMGLDYFQYASSPIPLGFLYIASPTGFTQTAIVNAVAAGFLGIYLNPTVVYNSAAISVHGIYNFAIQSTMYGYLRNNPPTGYINFTNTSGDSFAMYTCNQVQFIGVAMIATTTGSTLHFGGGIHASGGTQCYIQNLSNSAGSGVTTAAWGYIIDTQLVNNSSEDNAWSYTYFDGKYGAVAIGLNDGTQQANDSKMDNVRVAGAQYCVYHLEGGGWTWINLYDRVSAGVACFYVSSTNAGNISFIGGEPWQNSTAFNLSVNGGAVSIEGRMLFTYPSGSNGLQVTGGALDLISGRVSTPNCPLAVSGGTVNFSPNFNGSNFNITGAGGTVYLCGPAGVLTPYTSPTYGSYTGTVRNVSYPAVLPWTSGAPTGTGITSTLVTLSYTPPNAVGHYRIVSNVRCSAYVAAIAPTITYNNDGGGSTSGVPSYFKPGTAAGVVSIVATGAYSSVYEFFTDNSGTAITWTVASSTSTYSYSCWLERIA